MALAMLMALALQSAPEAASKVYEVEFAPLTPSERMYAVLGPSGPYYPEVAVRNNLSGEALLHCTVGQDGELRQCAKGEESPSGSAFADAAWLLAARRRIRVVGAAPVGTTITVRVPFSLGAPVNAMKRVVTLPTVKATAPDTKGHAEVGCAVADKGFELCFVLNFRSPNKTSPEVTADAALAAVSQAPTVALAKHTWVIIPIDFSPSAPPTR